MREQPLHFGADGALVGVLTEPYGQGAGDDTAFVFLNSGILHRVGPNRMYVTLARELAANGAWAFRIDLAGIGDSPPRGGAGSLVDQWIDDVRAAMDCLQRLRGIERFVLVGNCSGAAIALVAAAADARVSGAVLVNLQGPRTHLRYYVRLLLTRGAAWRRIFSRTVRARDLVRALRGSISGWGRANRRTPQSAVDVKAALQQLESRGASLLLAYCSWDPGLDYHRVTLSRLLRDHMAPSRVHTEIIPGMNHDFSLLAGQERLRRIVLRWAHRDRRLALASARWG